VLRVLRNPNPQALHTHVPGIDHADENNTRHWEARFDLPDAPPLPPTPDVVPLDVKYYPVDESADDAATQPASAPKPQSFAAPPPGTMIRALPGQPCPEEGEWFSPFLKDKTMHVKLGETMPGPTFTQQGEVIWYKRKGQ
jgi:hypothetical protein